VALHAEDGAIVTVTGRIDKPNRPAFDSFNDGFFAHFDISFEKGHAFSRRSLERLGMHSIALAYPHWPKAITFRGPRLSAVLAAAGAETGGRLFVQALDGYAAEFPWAFAMDDRVILAIEADGRPLAVGGRGPAWLVFPPELQAETDKGTDAGLVWAVFHIKVQ
jgi:hypothetical protein